MLCHNDWSTCVSLNCTLPGGTASESHAAAVALLAGSADAGPEPWTQLQGIAEVLGVMEAAVSQNIYLPQLMLYRWAGAGSDGLCSEC
jgi:hypothetical protein